jgi:hypothetical protein
MLEYNLLLAPLDLDMAAVIAEAERKVPGMLAHMEPDNPGIVVQRPCDTLPIHTRVERQVRQHSCVAPAGLWCSAVCDLFQNE